jgi:hypothetical protein
MHGQQNLKKHHYYIYRKYELEIKGTVKSIKNKSSLKRFINAVWFQNVLFSDLMLRSRPLKTFHSIVGVLSITEFGMKESHGHFKFTKTGTEF